MNLIDSKPLRLSNVLNHLPTMHNLTPPRAAAVLPLLRRALDCWPYIFIAISLSGLAYVALTSIH